MEKVYKKQKRKKRKYPDIHGLGKYMVNYLCLSELPS